jgi:hypothetical protein
MRGITNENLCKVNLTEEKLKFLLALSIFSEKIVTGDTLPPDINADVMLFYELLLENDFVSIMTTKQ